MKIINNDFIPFGKFKAMNLFGLLFVKGDAKISDKDMNHEKIHTAQQKELLFVLFCLWYVIEWAVRLFQYKDAHLAYRNISFEREAYANEDNLQYLESRPIFEFFEYIKEV